MTQLLILWFLASFLYVDGCTCKGPEGKCYFKKGGGEEGASLKEFSQGRDWSD